MFTLGEVLILATPRGAVKGKILLLWVFRALEKAFATIADLKMLSDTDRHTKPQPQSPCTFMQISLYIILLTRNSIPSKIAFPWSHLHLYNCLRSSYYNCCHFAVKKVSSSIQRDTPWCLKSMLNSNLRQDPNSITFISRRSVPIHGFQIVSSSILVVFLVLLENVMFLNC